MTKLVSRQGKTVKSVTVTSRKLGTRRFRKGRARKQLYNRTSVPVGLGFPKRMVMTHKYCLIGNVQSTFGVINNYIFSCNSLFAPSSGGSSHQPLYFDQMASIYNHYTVIGSKIFVKFIPRTATQTSGAVGLHINDDTSQVNITDIAAMSEQSQSKMFKLIPAGSNNVCYMTSKWSAKKTFGGSVLGNDDLQGSATSSPVEQSHFQVFYQDLTGSTSTIDFIAEIHYIAVWDELKDIAQS